MRSQRARIILSVFRYRFVSDLEDWTDGPFSAVKPCREAPRQMSIFLRCALYPRARKVGSAAGPTFVRAHAQGEHAQGEHAERRVKADVAVRAGAG